MVTKTTGAEFKRFYNDQAYWPDGAYIEDEELIVNGSPFDEYGDITMVDDDALIKVLGGIVYLNPNDSDGPSFESFFKSWRKAQTTIIFTVECDKGKADSVKAVIKQAGGKII